MHGKGALAQPVLVLGADWAGSSLVQAGHMPSWHMGYTCGNVNLTPITLGYSSCNHRLLALAEQSVRCGSITIRTHLPPVLPPAALGSCIAQTLKKVTTLVTKGTPRLPLHYPLFVPRALEQGPIWPHAHARRCLCQVARCCATRCHAASGKEQNRKSILEILQCVLTAMRHAPCGQKPPDRACEKATGPVAFPAWVRAPLRILAPPRPLVAT